MPTSGFSLPARFPHASAEVLRLNPGLTAAEITRATPLVATSPASSVGRVPNKTEALYKRLYLDPRIASGEIIKCEYEVLTFRLAHDTRYTPDWCCWLAIGGVVELHECKGAKVWDDALVKAKVAATMFPHRFVLARKIKDNWTVLNVPGWWTAGNNQVQGR